MSNKKAKNYKKRTKKKSSRKKAPKIAAVQSSKNTIGDCQKIECISLEEILDRIAAFERKGDITHVQALEVAERYANVKPGEVVVPKEVYDSWTDNGAKNPVFIHRCY